MEFDQRPDGRVPLPFTSVDTGMGLERLASVLQQVPSNFDTDLFTADPRPDARADGPRPGARSRRSGSATRSSPTTRGRSTFLIADGVLPSNEGRGYVLRRIVRRAVRHGRLLGRREPFLAELGTVVIEHHGRGLSRTSSSGATRSSPRSSARRRSSRGRSTRARASSRRRSTASSPDAERVVGRRPEDAAGRRAGAPRRPRVPPPRHVRLPDRPDRRARRRVRRRASTGAGFEAALAEQRERSRSGKKAELAKHAELDGALPGDPGARRRHRVPRLRDDDAPTARVVGDRPRRASSSTS